MKDGPREYYKSYRDLKSRQRRERVDTVAKSVLAMCVNAEKVLSSKNYFTDDEDLRTAVKKFLGEVSLRLEKELGCNFLLDDKVTPSPEEVKVDETTPGWEESDYFKEEDWEGSEDGFKIAVSLLTECTLNGYQRIQKKNNRYFLTAQEMDIIFLYVN